MHRIVPAIAIVLLAAACGGDSPDPAPNATFTGPIATQPGVSGEIGFVISESGDGIVSANLGVRFDDFDCGPGTTPITVPGIAGAVTPSGVTLSGGGSSVMYTPPLVIEDGKFEAGGFAGEFDSPTSAQGTLDIGLLYDCGDILTWTAESG